MVPNLHLKVSSILPMQNPIQGGPKITERHTSGNKDIR